MGRETDLLTSKSSPGTGWDNTEFRSYEFADPSGRDEGASLRELPASWRRRRGSAVGLTETEQRELRAVMNAHLEKEIDQLEQQGLAMKFDE